MSAPAPSSFVRTRVAAHTVAEHVLCAVRYAAVGRVGLVPVDDGIATPPFGDRVVGLRGIELVDVRGGVERRAPLTTLRAAGEFVGVVPGPPPLWTPTTAADPDEHLVVDTGDMTALAAWFDLVAGALAIAHPGASPTLWPEHFDLAVTVDDATYGGSPGDDSHPQPYVYVVPPGDPVPDGDRRFWGESFGAALSQDRVPDAAAAAQFFAEARDRLTAATTERNHP